MDKVSGFTGKGSNSRVSDKKAFDDNYEKIFARKDKPDKQPSFKMTVNGKPV